MKKILVLIVAVLMIAVNANAASIVVKEKGAKQVTWTAVQKVQVTAVQKGQVQVVKQPEVTIQTSQVIVMPKMKLNFSNSPTQLPDQNMLVQKKLQGSDVENSGTMEELQMISPPTNSNNTGENSNSGKDVIKDLTMNEPPTLNTTAVANSNDQKAKKDLTMGQTNTGIALTMVNNTNTIG